MIWPVGNAYSAIGVSYDSRFVTAVQLARRGQLWRLAAAGCMPRVSASADMDGQEAALVRGMLMRQGFKGNDVVLALPVEKLRTGVLDLPLRGSGAPVDDIAVGELARMHGYDPGAAETVCWDLPASSRAQDVTHALAVACRHADAEAILDAFQGAGLKVVALDSRLNAVIRACRAMVSASGISAILELGWDWAMLGLLYQGVIIYQRIMPEGGVRQLAEAMARRLNLEADSVDYIITDVGLGTKAQEGQADLDSFETAISMIKSYVESTIAELNAPFSYALRQYAGSTVDRILVTGYGAAIPGVMDHIRSKLEFDLQMVTPADVVQCPTPLPGRSDHPLLTAAVGLAQFGE